MAQKVNPIAVRLGLNKKADSSWFSDYYYATLFFQDYYLRNCLNSLKQSSGNRLGLRTAKCVIHHYPKKSTIHLFCLGKARSAASNYGRDTNSTLFSPQSPVNSALRNKKILSKGEKHSFIGDKQNLLFVFPNYVAGSVAQQHSFFLSSGWTNITCNKIEKTVTIDSQNRLSTSSYPKMVGRSAEPRSVPSERFATKSLRASSTAFLQCNEFGAGNYSVMQYFEKKKTGQSLCAARYKPGKVKTILNTQSPAKLHFVTQTDPKHIYLPVFELQRTYNSLPKVIKRKHNSLSHFQNVLCNYTNVLSSIKPIQVTSIYQSASLVAQEICFQLEQTKSFRQVCKTILKEIEQRNYIKGIRIMCSGRLNGAEIAKTECKKFGETSLHVFSDQIDYATKQASTPYGILGVKVWISYLHPSNALRK